MTRILVDTGPLVALVDDDDADHARCVATAKTLTGTLVTTWPVITEACYLLSDDLKAQDALLAKIESGDLVLDPMGPEDIPAIRALLHKYRDLPADLADATLVRLADRDGLDNVFTLDEHFHVYRTRRRRPFRMVR
jgi:uncharacterized protein